MTGLQDAVILDDPTSSQYQKWVNPAPLTLTAYVYHVVNPVELIEGATPIIEEMGPYVYHQYTTNYDLAYGNDATDFPPESSSENKRRTIAFRTYSWYEFIPELSVGPETDNLTTVNMPFVSMRAYYESKGMYTPIYDLFTMFSTYKGSTEAERLFSNRTVHEALFGWEDPTLELLDQTYRGYITNYASFNASLLNPYNDQFMNIIYTGTGDDLAQVRNYLVYHNQSFIATCPLPSATDMCDLELEIPAWNNNTNGPPLANGDPSDVAVLRGNDGSVFPTPINEQSVLTTYYTPFIRSIDLEYIQPSTYKGVPLLQFGFPPEFFANSTVYPPNAAYFQDGPNGLINLTDVQGTIPLYVSPPRFGGLAADATFGDTTLAGALNISFLGSASEISGTIYEVEPQSGVTFHVLTSSQVNVYISPLPNMPPHAGSYLPNETVSWFANMKPVYLPAMWAQAEGGIDDHDASTVTAVLWIIDASQYGGLIIGIILAVLAVAYLFLSWRTWDLENTRHLSAVRSLLASHSAGVCVVDGGSLLDASVLVMHDDLDREREHDGQQPPSPSRRGIADIDITYRSGPHPEGSETEVTQVGRSYQQEA